MQTTGYLSDVTLGIRLERGNLISKSITIRGVTKNYLLFVTQKNKKCTLL